MGCVWAVRVSTSIGLYGNAKPRVNAVMRIPIYIIAFFIVVDELKCVILGTCYMLKMVSNSFLV